MKADFRRLSFALVACLMTGIAACHALTTTYTFSAPDDVFVTVTPGGPIGSTWPSQLLNTRTATETKAGVAFRNDVNNTVFLDGNALQVSNAPVLGGVFAWADVMFNGPTDAPIVEMDFTNWIGGKVKEVQFDFALAMELPVFGAIGIDSQGHVETLTAPVSSFTFGQGQQGSQGHATLTPTGSLIDIAKLQFEFGVNGAGSLQFGFDNLVIENGRSADFGGDGTIDADDLMTWQSAYGSSSGGDADGDGDSDGHDFLIWQKEYTGPSPIVAAVSVPEPTPLVLGLFAIASLTPVARRRVR